MSFWINIEKPILALAPMEDVTDTVFRRVIASCGKPDVFFTEFMSADGLYSPGRERVIERLEYTEEERPLVAQIWGNKPENYHKACQEISTLGFDGIDINMGCPVNKIASKGCCSALIDNPSLAKELILAAKEGAQKLPVSVKTRLGYRNVQTEEWFSFLLDLDLDVITVHGRVAKHQSKYPADWNEIKKVVDLRNKINPRTLIIGNGDINSKEDIELRVKETKVDGVMIGRGIFHNPFIFNKTKSKHIDELNIPTRLDLLSSHLDLYEQRWGPERRYAAMKKFYKVYISSFQRASELRQELMNTSSSTQALEIIKDFKQNLE